LIHYGIVSLQRFCVTDWWLQQIVLSQAELSRQRIVQEDVAFTTP